MLVILRAEAPLSKRVLIIDDETDMHTVANELLNGEGFIVQYCEHPTEGLKSIRQSPPDILLLDIRLPEKDGLEILKELKADPKTRHFPVILVSVKSEETDVVLGLELGAEDYVTKPFRKRELMARIKTALRRSDAPEDPQTVQSGPIKLDYGRYEAQVKNKPVNLTPKEFELLGFLMKREGRVVTRPTISQNVWQSEFTGSTRTIDVHVDQLRRKLGRHGAWIKGLKGIGYRFEPD